jgi:two-component system, response regulator PdtaR
VQKPTILVVEDEVLVRMMLGDALREQGYAVIEAANADEAITVLRSSTHVDLVLSDIRMPGAIDGLALAHIIRNEYPNLKIVLASAYSISPAESRAHAFIRKPYNLAEVARQVRNLIGE